VHVRTADGRGQPADHFGKRSVRDQAVSPELDIYRWHFGSRFRQAMVA
jgi:hypothetical protein